MRSICVTTRYALRGEKGFISYRSNAISNEHISYIEFATANISTIARWLKPTGDFVIFSFPLAFFACIRYNSRDY